MWVFNNCILEQLFSFRYTKNTPNFNRTYSMNSTRKIIHIDMDCFYASIEIRENPTLQGKPVAVGGSSRQRGVLTTCNYEARKFGLHSAMPTAQAIKKCPNLILVPVNMPLYKQVSAQIHQIFQRYTSIIEPLSLDEAYLDVTDCTQCSGSATWIAQEIRQAIFDELKLTASAGVAPLKFLAKIASDMNKPNGQFVIQPHEVEQFVKTLPLKKIPGVGKKTAERLLVELKGKFKDVRQSDFFVESKHIPSTSELRQAESSADEAVAALVALGYKPTDAEKMVKKVAKADLSSEQLIREALKAAL